MATLGLELLEPIFISGALALFALKHFGPEQDISTYYRSLRYDNLSMWIWSRLLIYVEAIIAIES